MQRNVLEIAEKYVYENGQVLGKGPKYVKEKNSVKQIWIMRPNACALPLVPDNIFRDMNTAKPKSMKVGVRGPSADPGGVQSQRARWGSGDFAP